VRSQRLADLLTRGWVRLAGHLDTGECAALAKPQALPWAEMAPKVGAVTQHGWFAQLPFQKAPAPVRAFGSVMRATVSAALGQHLPEWTDATWQRYEPGYGHIGPHRDQAYYTGVIAIVTLSGEAEFTVLASRTRPCRWLAGPPVAETWSCCEEQTWEPVGHAAPCTRSEHPHRPGAPWRCATTSAATAPGQPPSARTAGATGASTRTAHGACRGTSVSAPGISPRRINAGSGHLVQHASAAARTHPATPSRPR
jgi:hypothetical protein